MTEEILNPFSALTSEQEIALAAQTVQRTFKAGDYLFRSGDPVKGIFSIKSGVARISQLQGDKEITVRFAAAGEWVGHRSVFTSDTYRGSARAKENLRADFVPSESLLHLLGTNRNFADRLIRLIARDLDAVERRLVEQQKLSVPSRLISLFRSLDKTLGKADVHGRLLSTKITKVEIGEMVGASQEVVSRQLSKWKKEGLLREDGKRILLSNRLLERVIR